MKSKKEKELDKKRWGRIKTTLTFVALALSTLAFFKTFYLMDDFSTPNIYYSPMKYINDPAVLNVTAICESAEIKSKCVYDNIPFNYTDRILEDNPAIIPPEDLYIDGKGICRDIALFRMAVFYNLKMSASYVFEPSHIYVAVKEGSRIYELNNEALIIWSAEDYELK